MLNWVPFSYETTNTTLMVLGWYISYFLIIFYWRKLLHLHDWQIAMHILEAILQDSFGIQHICNPISDHILKALIRGWDQLVKLMNWEKNFITFCNISIPLSDQFIVLIKVTLLAADQDFSPRLLFHIIRCYILLSTNKR